MSDLRMELSIGIEGFISNMNKAEETVKKNTEGISGRASRMINGLQRQLEKLTMSQYEIDASRAAALNHSKQFSEIEKERIAALSTAVEMERRNQEERKRIEQERLAAAQQELVASQKRQSAIDGVLSSLDREALSLTKSSSELQTYTMTQNGATQAEIERAQSLQSFIASEREAQESARQQQSAIDGVLASLEKEASVIGKSKAEINDYVLSKNGATEADKARMYQLQSQIDAEQRKIDIERNAIDVQREWQAQERAREQSINSLLGSIKQEEEAIGKTSSELKLMKLESQGATEAQLNQAKASLSVIDANRKQAASALESASATQQQGNSFDALIGKLKTFAALTIGGIGIKGSIDMMDTYSQLSSRIQNASESTEEFTEVQKRLSENSEITFRALAEATEGYLGYSTSMKALGYSTREILDLNDSLSFSFTANAARADQAQSANDALAKSMAKGKVDANAWMSILMAADNVAGQVAKTMGVAESEVRNLGASGKLSLDDLLKGLIAARGENEQLAKSMSTSFADGMTNLQNKTTELLGKFNEATGFTQKLSDGIGVVADNIQNILVPAITLLGVVAYNKAAVGFSAMTAGLGSFMTVLKANPIGFAITGIASLAAATDNLDTVLTESKKWFDEFFFVVKEGYSGLGDLASAVYTEIANVANGSVNKQQLTFTTYFDNTGGGFLGMLTMFGRVIDGAVTTIGAAIDYTATALRNLAVTFWNTIADAVNFLPDKLGFKFMDKRKSSELSWDKSLDKVGGSVFENGAGAFFEKFGETTRSNIEAQQKQTEAINQSVSAEKERKDAIERDQKFVEDSISKLNDKYNTIGKSADEVQRMQLAAKGATSEELKKVSVIQREIEARERSIKTMERLNGIDYRVATYGMSSRAKELYDLKQGGATAEQLSYADKRLRELESLERSSEAFKTAVGTMSDSVNGLKDEEKDKKKEVPQVEMFSGKREETVIDQKITRPLIDIGNKLGNIPMAGWQKKDAIGDDVSSKEAITLKIMNDDGKESVGKFITSKDGVKMLRDIFGQIINQEALKVRG